MSIIYLTDCLTSDTKIKLAAILVRLIVIFPYSSQHRHDV